MRTLLLTVLAALLGSTARAETLYFIHVDHLGTPRLAVGEDMVERWRWDQAEPFGDNPPIEVMGPEGYLVNLPLRFPGQYADKETNLHYNMARDYSPEIGRYIQSDPIGLRGGLNTYAYVKSRPLNLSDYLGLWDEGRPHDGGGGDGKGAQGICRLIAQLPIGTSMQVLAWYCIYRCETLSCPPKVWIYQTVSVWKWGCQDTIPARPIKPGLEPD